MTITPEIREKLLRQYSRGGWTVIALASAFHLDREAVRAIVKPVKTGKRKYNQFAGSIQ